MCTLRFFSVSTIVVLATSILIAQDTENSDESFTLKFSMTHATDQIVNETIVVNADVKTEIPIRQTSKLEKGGSASWVGNIHFFVPSLTLMSHLGPGPNPKTIEVGPKLTCRVRRGSDGQRLLDVEMIETQAEKVSQQDGILNAILVNLYQFNPCGPTNQ